MFLHQHQSNRTTIPDNIFIRLSQGNGQSTRKPSVALGSTRDSHYYAVLVLSALASATANTFTNIRLPLSGRNKTGSLLLVWDAEYFRHSALIPCLAHFLHCWHRPWPFSLYEQILLKGEFMSPSGFHMWFGLWVRQIPWVSKQVTRAILFVWRDLFQKTNIKSITKQNALQWSLVTRRQWLFNILLNSVPEWSPIPTRLNQWFCRGWELEKSKQ